MDQIILMKSQKNEIFNLIKVAKLDPFNFKWSVVPSEMTGELDVSRIDYIDSEFFYLFDIYNEKHYAIYSPGEGMMLDKQYPGDWEHQVQHVCEWLSYLRREVNQPDLWTEISKYQLPLESGLVPDISNEPFSAYHVEPIQSGLNQVRAYIEEQELASEEQSKAVNEKLDYLADAAKRQGRRDWIHTCIGVIFTIAFELALSQENRNVLFNLMGNAISGIIPALSK